MSDSQATERLNAVLSDAVMSNEFVAFMKELEGLVKSSTTIAATAQATGLSRQNLHKLFSGKSEPSLPTIAKLLDSLGLQLRVDVADEEDQKPLQPLGLLSHLTREERETLRSYGEHRRYHEGTTILTKSASRNLLLILQQGQLDVVLPKDCTLIAKLNPGSCVGEMGLIDQQPAAATVLAATNVLCWQITYSAMERAMISHPKISLAIHKGLSAILSRRLRNLYQGRSEGEPMTEEWK